MKYYIQRKGLLYLKLLLFTVLLSCAKEDVENNPDIPNDGKETVDEVYKITVNVITPDENNLENNLTEVYSFEYKNGSLSNSGSRKILNDVVLNEISKTNLIGFPTEKSLTSRYDLSIEKTSGEDLNIGNLSCEFKELPNYLEFLQCQSGKCTQLAENGKLDFTIDPSNPAITTCSFELKTIDIEDEIENTNEIDVKIKESDSNEIINFRQNLNLINRHVKLTKYLKLEANKTQSEEIIFKTEEANKLTSETISIQRVHLYGHDGCSQGLASLVLNLSSEDSAVIAYVSKKNNIGLNTELVTIKSNNAIEAKEDPENPYEIYDSFEFSFNCSSTNDAMTEYAILFKIEFLDDKTSKILYSVPIDLVLDVQGAP